MDTLDKCIKNMCDVSYSIALDNCKTDFVDEESCFWYHSVWQYLRAAHFVSSPDWHLNFYRTQIRSNISQLFNKNDIKILISGCADISMLYILVDALKEIKGIKGEIVVLDLCDTPLKECQYWWDNAFKDEEEGSLWLIVKNNFRLKCECKNLFMYSIQNRYDLIVTDAFLTRFPKETVPAVLLHWKNLLKENGKVITTVRIYNSVNEITLNARVKKIDRFVEQAMCYLKNIQFKSRYVSYDRLRYKIKCYAVKMESNSLGNESDITELFKNNYFKVLYTDNCDTCGELERARYLRCVICSSKRN